MCSVSEVGPDLLRRESLGGVGHKATDGSGPIARGKPREPLYHEVSQCKLATISCSLYIAFHQCLTPFHALHNMHWL